MRWSNKEYDRIMTLLGGRAVITTSYKSTGRQSTHSIELDAFKQGAYPKLDPDIKDRIERLLQSE